MRFDIQDEHTKYCVKLGQNPFSKICDKKSWVLGYMSGTDETYSL